jgi:ABC-type antimicrobial peptide transport system permease subunit
LSKISAIEIGIRNLMSQKSRSILTILGTAIGITGMVLMMGIGSGAKNKINSELGGFLGDNTIWVKGEEEDRVFDDSDFQRIKEIEGVDKVFDNNRFYTMFNYQDISTEGTLDTLAPVESRTEYELNLAAYGTLPKENDSREVVLTSEIAVRLLNGSEDVQKLIGEEITMLSILDRKSVLTYEVAETFTVVGIIDSGIVAGPSYIPYDTAALLAAASSRTEKAIQEGLEVIVSDKADYNKVVSDIRNLGYKVSTNKEDFENINTMVFALRIFLLFIAAVALFVSGIMIKIVLQTNVIERTKEIGIMCAIGAGRKDVKRIFMAEAGVLGALAGIVGVILGEVAGAILNTLLAGSNTIKFNLYDMSIRSIIFCIMISIFIAVISGRKPAKKAARVNPTEALRYE